MQISNFRENSLNRFSPSVIFVKQTFFYFLWLKFFSAQCRCATLAGSAPIMGPSCDSNIREAHLQRSQNKSQYKHGNIGKHEIYVQRPNKHYRMNGILSYEVCPGEPGALSTRRHCTYNYCSHCFPSHTPWILVKRNLLVGSVHCWAPGSRVAP